MVIALFIALFLSVVPVRLAFAQSPPDAAAPAPAAAPAQAAPAEQPASDTGTAPESIVITATRRAELLGRVPISVSAFTQEALDARGAKDFTDVVRFTPGVTLDANGTNNISIRGISSSAGSGTTGVYIDDTPIQMRSLTFYSNDALPKTFDLDRIEVLRGPQGTLFGAGSEGGSVRYIMSQPNMHQASLYSREEVSFTQGGAPSYEAGVAYGAPVVDGQLGYRASIWYRHDGGWIDRIDPFTFQTVDSHANDSDDVMVRLAAKWAISDRVSVTPSILYQNLHTNDATAYWPVFSNPSSNSYKNSDPDRQPEPDRYYLPALKVEADLGDELSLISNTSYFHRYDLSGYNGTIYNLSYYQTFNNPTNPIYLPMVNPGYYPLIDGSGLHLPASLHDYRAPAMVTNGLQSFVQEVRLQSDPKADLTWTTGLFYSVNRQTSLEEIRDPMINQFFQTIFAADYTQVFGEALLPNGDAFSSYTYDRDRQIALYGEATYALTDKVKVTAGARISKVDVNTNSAADGPQNFGPSGSTGSQHEKPFTPKASLAYQMDRDDLFYLTYAKGYRIGGANPAIPASACSLDLGNLGLSAAPNSYRSDTVKSYEIGAKNRVTEQLWIASSLYYIQWRGIQQDVYLPNCGFFFTDNFGDAVSKGGDMQVEYTPISWLNFDLAIGYTDARYTTDVGTANHLIAAAGDAIEGASFTPAPPWTVALGTQYNFMALNHKAFARLDWEYASRNGMPTATEDPRTGSFDPLAYTPSSTNFVSLRAGTTVQRWTVSAFVDNLLNTHPTFPPSAYPHTQTDAYNPNPPSVVMRAYTFRPRTIGITTTYHM
jgi:iron complex outermembrane recepter protein